jgi:hypothetical protein
MSDTSNRNEHDEGKFSIDLEGQYSSFDYDNVRPHLEKYPLLDLLAFSNGELGNTLGNLRLLRGDHMNIIILPTDEMVHIDVDNIGAHDLDEPEALSRLTYSAHHEYSEYHGKPMPSYTPSEWDKVDWVASDEPVKDMAIGGSTDFYSRFGVWPHYEVTRKNKFLMNTKETFPLEFIAEIIVNNRHAYIFYDVNYALYGEAKLYYTDLFISNENGEPIKGAYAVLFDDSDAPSWISMKKLKDTSELPLTSPDARYVNASKLPYAPGWVQEDETLSEPFNHFLAQIDEFDDAIYGDNASLYIFWDKQRTAHIFMQSN